jgi:NDP-sugar pyrophosphorylase family protein
VAHLLLDGVVVMDGDRIVRFVEKPPKGTEPCKLAASGIYIMEPEIKDWLPEEFLDSTGMLFPILLKKGAVINGYIMKKFWIDVGFLETYLAATTYILKKYKKKNWVEPGVKLGKGTKLEGAVVIYKGTTIGNNCLIKNSIIFKNNKIGNDCKIINAVIDEDCSIADNAVVSGIVGKNSKLKG